MDCQNYKVAGTMGSGSKIAREAKHLFNALNKKFTHLACSKCAERAGVVGELVIAEFVSHVVSAHVGDCVCYNCGVVYKPSLIHHCDE